MRMEMPVLAADHLQAVVIHRKPRYPPTLAVPDAPEASVARGERLPGAVDARRHGRPPEMADLREDAGVGLAGSAAIRVECGAGVLRIRLIRHARRLVVIDRLAEDGVGEAAVIVVGVRDAE